MRCAGVACTSGSTLLFSGVVLPVLGALPDSLIVLTALNQTRAEAQESLGIGIGTLAGVRVPHTCDVTQQSA